MKNPYLCMTIIACLGLGALIGTGGLIYLAAVKIDAPPTLISTVSFCWGSLASFLVAPPKGSAGNGAPTAPNG